MSKQTDSLKDFTGTEILQCVSDSFVILYGNGEYEIVNGNIETAIQHAKSDNRFKNYGHDGATIIAYRKIYSINEQIVEHKFV